MPVVQIRKGGGENAAKSGVHIPTEDVKPQIRLASLPVRHTGWNDLLNSIYLVQHRIRVIRQTYKDARLRLSVCPGCRSAEKQPFVHPPGQQHARAAA